MLVCHSGSEAVCRMKIETVRSLPQVPVACLKRALWHIASRLDVHSLKRPWSRAVIIGFTSFEGIYVALLSLLVTVLIRS